MKRKMSCGKICRIIFFFKAATIHMSQIFKGLCWFLVRVFPVSGLTLQIYTSFWDSVAWILQLIYFVCDVSSLCARNCSVTVNHASVNVISTYMYKMKLFVKLVTSRIYSYDNDIAYRRLSKTLGLKSVTVCTCNYIRKKKLYYFQNMDNLFPACPRPKRWIDRSHSIGHSE